MAQALRHQSINLFAEPHYSDDYRLADDPLWSIVPKAPLIDVLSWYQCDHLGTPQELTNQNGEIVWSAQYKAWGTAIEKRSEWALQQGLANPIRFQGQYHDHETGLHYNRYRYYDPDVGRFISKDPISYAGGLNLYAYAPNPTGWVDPLGLEGCDPRQQLADRRKALGLPVAGSAEDTSTLAILKVNGQSFEGINSSAQKPKTPITLERVNAQTKTHAEAEAVQHAVNAGMAGKAESAEMWVDRDPCKACGLPGAGGIRSLARNLGCNITVHSPSGSRTYTPTK